MTTRLEEIAARWAAATPGPWVEDDGNVLSKPLGDARYAAVVAKISGEPYDADAIKLDAFVATTEQRGEKFEEDALAIAAAPEDVAWLLEVADAAQALMHENDNSDDDRDGEKCWRAAIAALRVALARAT